jgi:hypothetical protein
MSKIEVKQKTTREPKVITRLDLGPDLIRLLTSALAKESSRYAICRVAVQDGGIVATDGSQAIWVERQTPDCRLKDGLYFIVGDEIVMPQDERETRTIPNVVGLFKSMPKDAGKLVPIHGMKTYLLSAIIKETVFLDVFRFSGALKAADSWTGWTMRVPKSKEQPIRFDVTPPLMAIHMLFMPFQPVEGV